MDARCHIQHLLARGIEIWPDGDRLRYRGDRGHVTPDDLADLATHRDALLQTLRETAPVPRPALDTTLDGNVWGGLHLSGVLEAAALKRAGQWLVVRHPALRATIGSTAPQAEADASQAPGASGAAGPAADGPGLVLHGHLPIDFQTTDASRWSDAQLGERARVQVIRPCDIARGPVLRVCLFTKSPQDHVLVVAAPRVLVDEWGLRLLLEELGVVYPAMVARVQPELPDDGGAAWIGAVRNGATRVGAPSLAGASRSASADWMRETFLLHDPLTRRLRRLAADQNVSLRLLLGAAFRLLVTRLTGRTDLPVELLNVHRDDPALAHVVGRLPGAVPIGDGLDLEQTLPGLVVRAAGAGIVDTIVSGSAAALTPRSGRLTTGACRIHAAPRASARSPPGSVGDGGR